MTVKPRTLHILPCSILATLILQGAASWQTYFLPTRHNTNNEEDKEIPTQAVKMVIFENFYELLA